VPAYSCDACAKRCAHALGGSAIRGRDEPGSAILSELARGRQLKARDPSAASCRQPAGQQGIAVDHTFAEKEAVLPPDHHAYEGAPSRDSRGRAQHLLQILIVALLVPLLATVLGYLFGRQQQAGKCRDHLDRPG
jgi:hypothetical protein